MMFGYGANPIFFNKKTTTKIGRPEHSLTPISFLPYHPPPPPPPPPPTPVKVDVICVSPLNLMKRIICMFKIQRRIDNPAKWHF